MASNAGCIERPRTLRAAPPAWCRLCGVLWFVSWIGLCGGMPAQAETLLIRNVHVLPMTGAGVLRSHQVLVVGDRIAQVLPGAASVSLEEVRVIDGEGGWLLPGLAEMHGHTPVPNGDPNGQFVADMMFLYVANGVTTVRGMLGAPGQLELRRMVADGELTGPTLYLAGPSFSGRSIRSPEQAASRVRQQQAEGWDLIKVHPGLSRAEYDAMARAASRVGLRFGGHVPEEVGLEHAIRMGQHTFDHIDGYLQHLGLPGGEPKPGALDRVAAMSRDARVWIVPTLVLWEHVLGFGDPEAKRKWPEMRYWPRRQVDNWHYGMRRRHDPKRQEELGRHVAARERVLAHLHGAGVGVLLGTDSPQIFSVPGFSIHREMAAMVSAGMDERAVLESGTRNVGEYLQGKDAFGVVAPGQRADLLIVRGDPLQGLDALERRVGVMVRGQWLAEAEIQRRLADIARRNAR